MNCSTFENNSQINWWFCEKEKKDNKFIFETYSFLEKEYSIFSPLNFFLNNYLHSKVFIDNMKNLNVKYKTNPILLERINIEGENN